MQIVLYRVNSYEQAKQLFMVTIVLLIISLVTKLIWKFVKVTSHYIPSYPMPTVEEHLRLLDNFDDFKRKMFHEIIASVRIKLPLTIIWIFLWTLIIINKEFGQMSSEPLIVTINFYMIIICAIEVVVYSFILPLIFSIKNYLFEFKKF